MPASIAKADGSRTPLGNLANYEITKSNVPYNPTDGSGQIPTFSATIVNPAKDAKTHLGDAVVLTDLNDEAFEGNVVSAQRGADSGLVQLDMNTMFERLNTVQTTYPVFGDRLWGNNMTMVALSQWLLMAGIPPVRLPGNLLHYITNAMVGFSSRTEATWVQDTPTKWLVDHSTYVPSYGTNLGRLDVNRSQSFILGMPLFDWSTSTVINSEVLMDTWVHSLDLPVRYRLLQHGSVVALSQSVNGGTYTTVGAVSLPVDATVSGTGFVFVRVKANATLADRVDITVKVIGAKTATGAPVVYEDTVASAVSHLRKRPELRKVHLGYDSANTGTDFAQYEFFISEGDVLPNELPLPQVELSYFSPTGKPLTAIPGFTGNVWEKIKELCSLVGLDISFTNDKIIFSDRNDQRSEQFSGTYIPLTPVQKSGVVESANQREKARTVEVVYREQPVKNSSAYYNNELWRADTVYTVEKGETLVEKIQTDSTFYTLADPIPVSGVPVPYTSTFGSYVVTGADGYIVDPQWWTDNGGSIKVQPTNTAGEIQITFQAPNIDTVRAPYRISEGVADRPALYIFGHGLKLEEPKTLKVYTGNPDAAEDVGMKVDSIFITNKLLAFNTAHKVAVTYGSGDSSLSYTIPRKENDVAYSGDPIVYRDNTSDHNVYHNGSVYRMEQLSIGPSAVSVSKAPRYNTHRILNGEYATGKTIGQQNAMNAGKKIKDTNLAPLPNYLS